MDWENVKKNIFLALFLIFLVFTILFVAMSVLYAVDYSVGLGIGDSKGYSWSAAIGLGVCSLSLFLITLAFFLFYRKVGRKVEREEDILGYLRLYRRISLETLAYNMKMSPREVEEILLDAISKGKIRAHIDRETKEIFVDEYAKQAKVENIRCPNCGAMVSGVYLIGETVKCPYCNTVFKVEK